MAEIKSLFGYTFREPLLLKEALTHGSHADRPTYQRLEFIGDAVLGLAVTSFLYLSNPSLGPGKLTVLRDANISTEKLARACVRHDLYRFLRCNDRALDQQVIDFVNSVQMKEEDEGEVSFGGSSCKAPKVLADIVESTAAAIYIDSNFNMDVVWKVFREILEPIIKNINDHPMTILKELMEKQQKRIKIRKSRKNTLHTAEIVAVDGNLVLGNGSASNGKLAKLNAARDALQKLLPDDDTEGEDGLQKLLADDGALKLLADDDIKNWKQGSLDIADVFIDGILVGSGSSEQKSIAKLNAARNTLQNLSSSQTADMDVEMCLTNGNETADEKGGSKKRLHELCCKNHWLKPIYKIEKEEGPEHRKRFVCSVHIETTDCAYVVLGDPKSRVKDAESSAASKLLWDVMTTE